MATASLALAACGGGGDSTVQTQPLPPVKRNPPTRDCTAVPRPDGCPDPEPTAPVVPMPLEGLSTSVQNNAAIAIQMSSKARPLTLTKTDKVAQHQTRWLYRRLNHPDSLSFRDDIPAYLRHGQDTKIAVLEPSGSSSDPNYKFDIFTSGSIATNPSLGKVDFVSFDYAVGRLGRTESLTGSDISSYKIFSIGMDTTDGTIKYEKMKLDLGFGEGWDSSLLKAEVNSMKDGEKDAMLHAEVWSTYPGDQTDYLVGGVWLMVPNDISKSHNRYNNFDYHAGAFAYGNVKHGDAQYGDMPYQVTGKARYTGNALGLHTSLAEGNLKVQRLVGKVTLMADFGDDTATTNSNHYTRAQIEGTINSLSLDGEKVSGEITLPQGSAFNSSDIRPLTASNGRSAVTTHNLGNIKGINYQGSWGGTFTGNAETNDQPSGVAGTVGGNEVDGSSSFILSFGAKKVEDNP